MHNDRKIQKIAIIHDWLNGMRGGEAVFDAILELYPKATVFTLVYEPEKLSQSLQAKLRATEVRVPFLNRFRFFRKYYRQLLPLLPILISLFDVSRFDLVISSSHCVAKGVRKSKFARHVCYIHAPMRYMWARFYDYFGRGKVSLITRFFALAMRPVLRAWDRYTSTESRVDLFIANSKFIADQVREYYGRDAKIVHPFADLSRFQLGATRAAFYLVAGAMAPYKRIDLAVEAFARTGLPLKIAGSGQDEFKLKLMVRKLRLKNIEFLGHVSDSVLEALYKECKALVFPGIEDFGITPIEAMASGAPVIAVRAGGACETVTNETGILFWPQSADELQNAILNVETGRKKFDSSQCRAQALKFSRELFLSTLPSLVEGKY